MTNPENVTPISDSEGPTHQEPAGAPQPEHVNDDIRREDDDRFDESTDPDFKVAENKPRDTP